MSGGAILLWTFGPDDADEKAWTEPKIAIIGVHTGYNNMTDENVGLVFMDTEHLIRLYGKEKWTNFFNTEEAKEEKQLPYPAQTDQLINDLINNHKKQVKDKNIKINKLEMELQNSQ